MSEILVNRQWYEKNTHLVSMQESSTYPGLFVMKYKKRVFYDNLWTPELEQCRGLVVDKNFDVVVRPFDKVFNYGENGTTFDRDELVIYARKVNGFLGCVTNTSEYGTIFSTTGSMDSSYAQLVRSHLEGRVEDLRDDGVTYLFEICDASDPHIIQETTGAYLIGAVRHSDGFHYKEEYLDEIANFWEFKRYCHEGIARFSDVVRMSKSLQHEGFMVRSLDSSQQSILKIKSPYYLTMKFFARKNEGKLDKMLSDVYATKQRVDEEFYPLLDHLAKNKHEFIEKSEQERLTYIREYFKNENLDD